MRYSIQRPKYTTLHMQKPLFSAAHFAKDDFLHGERWDGKGKSQNGTDGSVKLASGVFNNLAFPSTVFQHKARVS